VAARTGCGHRCEGYVSARSGAVVHGRRCRGGGADGRRLGEEEDEIRKRKKKEIEKEKKEKGSIVILFFWSTI